MLTKVFRCNKCNVILSDEHAEPKVEITHVHIKGRLAVAYTDVKNWREVEAFKYQDEIQLCYSCMIKEIDSLFTTANARSNNVQP